MGERNPTRDDQSEGSVDNDDEQSVSVKKRKSSEN